MMKKPPLIRKQILLTREQADRLTELAREDGVSVSFLVRDAIDFLIALYDPEMKALIKQLVDSSDRAEKSIDAALDSTEASRQLPGIPRGKKMTLCLDLEGTLIDDQVAPDPRPYLYEFLTFCWEQFDRIFIYSYVEEPVFRRLASEFVQGGSVPAWFAELPVVDWDRTTGKKDLRLVGDPADILLVEDVARNVLAEQRGSWIEVKTFSIYPEDRDPKDRELLRAMEEITKKQRNC